MKKNPYEHPKLYEAFAVYCRRWCEGLPGDRELADVPLSDTLQGKMRRLLRRQRYGFYVLFGTASRRVASILVMLLVSMTIATASVKALREPVVRFITQVFETFTSILFVDDEPPAPKEDMNLDPVEPAYLPAGYVKERETNSEMMYRISYYNAETEGWFIYAQRRDEVGSLTSNTEDVVYHTVFVNGIEGIAYENKGSLRILFVHGGCAYSVAGSLAEEELLRIAESIPVK